MQLYRSGAFSRERIQDRASLLGLRLTDQEQWDFLQSTGTLDLQAAPGSGKTSLVALKLLTLAEHWISATRGVCVLSHTNTAKDEIIARISDSPDGLRLRRYPHFIGTIQSFASIFLALPYLRGIGKQVHIIDDDAYADRARRALATDKDFTTLKSALRHRQNGDELVANAEFKFEAGKLEVRSSRDLPFRLETPSGKQFTNLKKELAGQGIFRYADMFALAEYTLFRHPSLSRAVTHRFPFVLIDEMQDTSAVQQKLLDRVFEAPSTIVQRVGDINQRIFTDDSTVTPSFPRPGSLELPVSRRFGSSIADLASSLTVRRSQHIRGAGPTGTITALLYDQSSVNRVVPTFERLASTLIPHEVLHDNPPRVLAARLYRKTSEAFPQSLACYVPEFATTAPDDGDGALLIAVRAARTLWESGSGSTAVDLLWGAIRTAAKTNGNAALPTLRALSRDLNAPGGRMRMLLLHMITIADDNEADWGGLMQRLTDLSSELSIQTEPTPITLGKAAHYLAPNPTTIAPIKSAENDDAVATVGAALGSIHVAKGETHTATLILECLNRSGQKHDVYEVLKLLATGGDLDKASQPIREIAQLIFVGATRPTQMLAFAVHRERAAPYLDYLVSNNWIICDLTQPISEVDTDQPADLSSPPTGEQIISNN